MTPDRSAVENVVREFLLENYIDLIAGVVAVADATSGNWNRASMTDRAEFVPRFRQQLADQEVLQRLPQLLREVAEAADLDLVAEPVAAPPYVVVTSTGLVLRGTAHRGRLVISVRTFAVRRGNQVRYERINNDAASAIEVEFYPD